MTPSSCALRASPERADTQHVRARVSTRLPRATWRLAHTAAPHACMRECVFETYRRSSAVIELCAEEESARSCSVLCAQPRAAGALGRSGATSVRLVCTGAKRGIALILRSLDALCVAFRASLVARSAAPLWPLEQTARAGQIRHAVIWHGSSGQIRHAVVYYTGGTVRVHEWHLPLRPGGRREVACGALHVAKTIHERHTLCRESLCVFQYCRFHLVCPGQKIGDRNFFWAWYKLKSICVAGSRSRTFAGQNLGFRVVKP